MTDKIYSHKSTMKNLTLHYLATLCSLRVNARTTLQRSSVRSPRQFREIQGPRSVAASNAEHQHQPQPTVAASLPLMQGSRRTDVSGTSALVARELAPAGLRSRPNSGPLRAPAGASSLATDTSQPSRLPSVNSIADQSRLYCYPAGIPARCVVPPRAEKVVELSPRLLAGRLSEINRC
ncbi:hypothetical protein QFZ84_001654 [Pseudomonas fluorescens]